MAIKKRRKPKTNRNYFTQDTEDAIIEYNKTEDFDKKSRIYQERIHYAFFKLTQNIIHTFKFYHTDVSDLEHLQHEIIIFLLGKIHLYHHSKNLEDRFKKIITKEFKLKYKLNFQDHVGDVDKVTQQQIDDFIVLCKIKDEGCLTKLSKMTPPKAFSYFGIITKRWLILYNTIMYKKKLTTIPAEELSRDSSHTYLLDESKSPNDKLSNFIDDYVEFINNNIYKLFPKEQDAKIADAILTLFRKRESIDIFNKKALYFSIRESGEFKTPKITKISDKMRDIFQENYAFYLEHDYHKFEIL